MPSGTSGWGWSAEGEGVTDRAEVLGYLVQDLFTDDNGTTLPNHTPDIDQEGGGWTDVVAGITIESNKASDNDATRLSVIDAGAADVTIEVDFVSQGGGNGFGGICFRYQDATHYIVVGLDVTWDKVTIWENNGGVWNERSGNGNGSFAVTAGQEYALKLVLSGNSIELFVDDVSQATASLAIFNTETEHGLYGDAAGGGVDATWDDFTIS